MSQPGAPIAVAAVINFRTADLALSCVASLRASEGITPHVLVIDNASGDDSAERLRDALGDTSNVTLLDREWNDGYTGAANAAVAWARRAGARYLVILNADTTVDRGCLRALVDDAERDASVALVNPRILLGHRPDALWFGGGRFSPWVGHAAHVGLNQVPSKGWTVARDESFATGCALLVRLAAVSDAPFDPSLFAYAEDLDLSLRLRADGWRLRFVPGGVVWHHETHTRRRPGGEAMRFYFTTRNLLRVAARHARWYHWPTLAPMLGIGLVGRLAFGAARRRDGPAFVAVLRGAWHAVSGGQSDVERALPTSR